MLGVGGLIDNLTGANKNGRLKGTVVLMRKNMLDLSNFGATILDGIAEFILKLYFYNNKIKDLLFSAIMLPVNWWKTSRKPYNHPRRLSWNMIVARAHITTTWIPTQKHTLINRR
jgi:hypothetical protein